MSTAATQVDACVTPGDRLLAVAEAIEVLCDAARPSAATENLALAEAPGRVLAEPLLAPIDVPGWDNSAMDGYALRASDGAGAANRLPVRQRIAAGQAGEPLEPGSAARIFTGAPLPAGADCVLMQEHCRADGDHIEFEGPLKSGMNVRRRGEDLSRGSEALATGTRLAAQHVGLAASLGIARLNVFRKLRVAVFSTGDELREPGEKLAAGQIYNSNRYMLLALAERCGCEAIDLGRVEDRLDATRAALRGAASKADLILTSGGVSVGEEDHVRAAVEAEGTIHLWRVAMKPGKPLAFGQVAGTDFIGLPGNPVSSFVTFAIFVRPYLRLRQGRTDAQGSCWREVAADFDWPHAGPRTEFARARLDCDGRARLYPQQGSGVLSSVVWADGLVEIPRGRAIRSGEPVRYANWSALLD